MHRSVIKIVATKIKLRKKWELLHNYIHQYAWECYGLYMYIDIRIMSSNYNIVITSQKYTASSYILYIACDKDIFNRHCFVMENS